MTTAAQTTTRKAHDLKGGDFIRISNGRGGWAWREVFDAYPNTESTYVVAFYNGQTPDSVTYSLIPTTAELETR